MAESTELIVEEGTKTASLHLSDTSFTLRVLLPWADVPESLCKSHSHLLLLTIVDAAECIDAPAPVMIVPLTVVRG